MLDPARLSDQSLSLDAMPGLSQLERDGAETSLQPPSWSGSARATATTVLRILNRGWLTRIGAFLTVLFVIVAVIGPSVAGDPLEQTPRILQRPSAQHWLGTDHLGRDILVRTVAGARISLMVALISVTLGLLIGLPLGLTAGYFGGSWIDELIMRSVDVIMAFPLFLLALAFLGITGTGPIQIGGLELPGALKVVVLIGIAAMPLFARVARAATLIERQEDYVDCLRVIGVSPMTIVTREILINVLPPVMVQAFLWMAIAVFAEAALSFLGLGVQAPNPSLGNLLQDARNYLLVGAWWYSLPGLFLLGAIVGLNLLGDGLSDTLDPQLRG